MKKYVILFLSLMISTVSVAADHPLKQIKKQMCFESFPRVTYDQNGTHEWTINEVINNPVLYKTYKLVISNKTKFSADSAVFDFTGVSRQYGKVVPTAGSAVLDQEGWTLSVNSSTKLGDRNGTNNVPYVSSLATWDMYSNITVPGTAGGFLKFDDVAQAYSSSYEVSVIRTIDCKDFDRNYPTVE